MQNVNPYRSADVVGEHNENIDHAVYSEFAATSEHKEHNLAGAEF